MAHPAYAELHCHTHFSFLDGASAPDDLVERAVELGLAGLAVTDHQGLYGAVRFVDGGRGGRAAPGHRRRDRAARRGGAGSGRDRRAGAAAASGDPAVGRPSPSTPAARAEGRPARPASVARPAAGPSGGPQGGPARDRRGAARAAPRAARPGRDGLAEPVPDGVAGEPRRDEGRAAVHPGAARGARRGARRAVGLPARASSRGGCGRATGRARGRWRSATPACSARGDSAAASGFVLELAHHLLPDDDWLVAETARLAAELGLPVVVTNDVHYAQPEGRELQDVLTAIRHGRSLRHAAPTCGGRTASRT